MALLGSVLHSGSVAGVPPPPSPCASPCPSGSCTSEVPGASDYENSLPVPSPAPGSHYVVQLVNESNVTILGATNAAHQGNSAPGGPVPPPVAVEPREGTWVMKPKGSPNNANILTIDVPAEWEGTQCPQTNPGCGADGPRFWARTGCKYDPESNLAQCETGSCGDAYECAKQALKVPPASDTGNHPVSIVEWTFNSQLGGGGYANPDISLVDGVSLTIDVQALGLHCASFPGQPQSEYWLSQRQPLAIHGTDLREAERCIPSFRLTRGEVGQIVQGEGNPDDVVACFTNCGRYEYPQTPAADCDPDTDEKCKNWLAFCCYAAPGSTVYGGACMSDSQCAQSGTCWNDGSLPCTTSSSCPSGLRCVDGVCAQPFCACRGFLKNEDCPADVCTHPYTPENRASQPPFGRCTDVTDDPAGCIGDDTVHEVFPGGYTWPNDPQTYTSDARVYRIIFAPGYVPGTSPPITDSTEVRDCSTFPDAYGYAAQKQNCGVNAGEFAGAALSPECTGNDSSGRSPDCPIQPGSSPPQHFSCITPLQRCATWACAIAPGGPVTTGDILCRWPTAEPTPTPTQILGGPPTETSTPRVSGSDGSCAVDPDDRGSRSGVLLVLVAAAAVALRSRRRRVS